MILYFKLSNMEIKYLFTYGSLILDSSKIKLTPIQSVFCKGYKLVVELSPITQRNYHYIFLEETGKEEDIIPGYLAEINDDLLEQLDVYEGKLYKRTTVTILTRTLEPIQVYTYVRA